MEPRRNGKQTFNREWTRRNANRIPSIRGNSSGAVFAAGLLCWPLPALLHAGILGVILTVIQLVGAKRYAVWTFCLTVIALDLKSVLPQEIGWRLGEERILLTIGGLALATLFSLRLP